MRKAFLECGKVVSTHGVRGEVKVQPWCDSAEFLLHFKTLYLNRGERPLAVEGLRAHKGMALLKLYGIDSLEQAVTLRGKILYIDREDAPPAQDGEYFIQDLLGLAVRDADSGQAYGLLSDVFPTGANDVYEVTGADGRKHLIPAIRDVIVKTDVDGGVLLIRPLKGLFGDAD